MWQGKYQKWNPIPHLENKRLYVGAVHDDWEGFRIWFGAEFSTCIKPRDELKKKDG
jgi:hypothetical protein